MMIHSQNLGITPSFFKEKRTVNVLGLTSLGGAIKGAMESIKGTQSEVVEKAGLLKRAALWMSSADSTSGYILKSPFILTRKAIGLVGWTFKTADETGRAVGSKLGGIASGPIRSATYFVQQSAEELIKAGYYLSAAPLFEVIKSNVIDFPKRAVIDQFRTGISMILGTTGAFLSRSLNAVKETALSPFTILGATRNAVKNILWNTPKALLKMKFKEAWKSSKEAATGLIDGVTRVPRAIADVPYHTLMHLGLGATETAMNATSAMAAPAEGVVNAYRAMGKAANIFDFIKQKVGVDTSTKYRERFKNLFQNRSPIGALAGATA